MDVTRCQSILNNPYRAVFETRTLCEWLVSVFCSVLSGDLPTAKCPVWLLTAQPVGR
jgi:hypothetical protein